MKTLILILGEEQSPALTRLNGQLEALLATSAPNRFELRSVSTLEDLKVALSQAACPSIIITELETDSLNGFMQDCLHLTRACSIITLVEDPDGRDVPEFPQSGWNQDAQFLKYPTDDFTLSAALAVAQQMCLLHQQMLTGNKLDEVDNLLSRSYFMHRLSEEISIARRHKQPLCCVIISINYYRMYLDSYGYQFTNALLRFVGNEINRLVRYEDQVARVGDDELALLLARCSEEDAKKLIERLAHTLNRLRYQYGDYEEELSVCAGVASFPLPDNAPATPDILIRYAHHALHQAKTSDEAEHCVTVFSEIKPKL